jgi:prevent-host-death family protein
MDTVKDKYGMADFKTHCLAILERVAETGKEVHVTKRGKPAVRILPDSVAESRPLYGFLKGSASWENDLFSAEESWDAQGT